MEERILFIKLDPKTETDIICWMNSLPLRTINKTVNQIIVVESRNKIARIPNEFSYTNQVEPLRCRLIFKSKAALSFLTKIPKGEYKATLVKIIRRHIEKSKALPPASFFIHRRYFYMATDRFVAIIKDKKLLTKGVPNRYDKLTEFYELAFADFSNSVFDCYKSVDRNHGNYNLYHLDCEDIINKAFVRVFGEIAKSENESVNENSVAAPEEPEPNFADENQEDRIYKILKYGLPDEEFKKIKEKLKERKNNEQ